ncbi:hypothetical protein [Reyranella sp.]|uniref:hypothetical protein n=1 Tax=Reyranella sp. TaxID=1929291 RepID=UPI00403643AA
MAKASEVAKDWGLGSQTRAKANPPARAPKVQEVKPSGKPRKEQATPETREKLQPDFLEKLLRAGPDEGGIDDQQFEALFEIEDAHTIIGKLTSARSSSLELSGGGDPTDMSDGEARVWAIWIAWGTTFHQRTGIAGTRIAELIKARFPVDEAFVGHYRTAAALWDEEKRKHHAGTKSGRDQALSQFEN